MEYILKSTAILTIFYLFYKIFLQRETFFHSIRSYFLTGIISAIVIPFVVITKYVQIEPVSMVSDMVFTEIPTVTKIESFNWIQLFIVIYLIGVLFFSLRFLWQLSSLIWFLYTHPKKKIGKFTLVKTTKNMAPFSFFNYIAYNRNQFKIHELNQILTHEKVHASQYHSIDILISQIIGIFNWFNPFIWFYNKEIQKNLEYVADDYTQNSTLEKKNYQYLLLKTISPDFKMALASNFYNTIIKKRIDMLQKNRSNKTMQLKFALIVPILIAFIFNYNTKVIAQTVVKEKKQVNVEQLVEVEESIEVIDIIEVVELDEVVEIEESSGLKETIVEIEGVTELKEIIETHEVIEVKEVEEVIEIEQDRQAFYIAKDKTEYDLNKLVADASNIDVSIKFKGIKRNDKKEITGIKIDVSSKNSSANFSTNSSDAIKLIKISISDNGSNISIGNASSHSEAIFVSKNWKNNDHNTFVVSSGSHSNKFIHKQGEDNQTIYEFKSGDSTKVWVSDDDQDVHFGHGKKSKGGNIEIISIKEGEGGKHKKHEIIVRGYGSDDGKMPLMIIDGKETKNKSLEDMDTENIESIEVLKGDGAIKEYGDKAKDGVIIITTKKK